MRNMLGLVLILWLLAFAGSFLALYFIEPEGSGFTRGANRVMAFGAGQMIAVVLAFMALALRWQSDDPRLRVWALIPAASVAVLLTGLAGLFIWAGMQ